MQRAQVLKLLFCLLALGAAVPSRALTGYNCGRGKPNISTISLVDIGNCDLGEAQPQTNSVFIQLLQKVEFEQIFVRQCKIIGKQRIRRCGMLSHVSDVEDGESTIVKKISADECGELARFGQFKYGQAIIAGIEVNKTTRQPATIAGTLKDDGTCKGTVFVTHGHEYEKAVVTIDFEITIQEFFTTLKRSSNEVFLPSGIICRFTSGMCHQNDESFAFWTVAPTPPCDYASYETLFQGFGTKVSENSTNNPEIYFANSTGNIQFGLAKTGEFTLCGYRIFRTEHPKLFIMETSPNFVLPAKQRIDVQDILLTAYFNTKLTYFARHVKTQLSNVYKDIVFHRCQIERQLIMNSLSLIATSPDEFALNIMKKPGFTAVAAGEVAYILQCEPIVCKIRQSPNCYAEMPVSCDNEPFFLRPKTKILTTIGTPRDCNSMLPILFKINNIWRSPSAALQHLDPTILQPMKTLTWKYEDVDDLLNDGIYSPNDLERLHDHSVFPMEKPALVENILRKLSGKPEYTDAISMRNLLDEKAIGEIAKSSIAKAWSGFLEFGEAAAGFLAVFIILHAVKALADVFIQGYTLYSIYGWSVHLLAALWSSLTHLLIYLAKPSSYQARNDIERADPTPSSTPAVTFSNKPSSRRNRIHYSTLPARLTTFKKSRSAAKAAAKKIDSANLDE